MSEDNKTAADIVQSLADQWQVTLVGFEEHDGNKISMKVGTPPRTGQYKDRMHFDHEAEGKEIKVSALYSRAQLDIGV